jgi:hypothetical protein
MFMTSSHEAGCRERSYSMVTMPPSPAGVSWVEAYFDDRLREEITQISRRLWRCEVSEIENAPLPSPSS